MFRRYFQTGDEDDAEGSSGEEEAEQTEQLPPPEEVWAQVSRCYMVQGKSGHPQWEPMWLIKAISLARTAYDIVLNRCRCRTYHYWRPPSSIGPALALAVLYLLKSWSLHVVMYTVVRRWMSCCQRARTAYLSSVLRWQPSAVPWTLKCHPCLHMR